jgi:hypothetical protein
LFLVLLITLVVCRTAPLYDRYNDDDDDNDNYETNNQLKLVTSEQLADYLLHKVNEESALEVLDRGTRYSNENHMTKRDALWTTTEVLDCVRRLKYSKDSSKLDLVTEMLNCYRRLRHTG